MSLKGILQGLGRLITKKAKPAQATGQQQKLITYTPETRKLPATEIAKKDLVPVNPRLQTGDLQMGEKVQPLFGSSTYDWAMRKGPGKYTADEWIDHLTTSRKVKFKVFGQPSTRIERGPKSFTYDRGKYAGKTANINKEELFDSNVAVFDEAGELAGGLLAAAKKYNIKLSAQDVGNFLRGNPANRLKAVTYSDDAIQNFNYKAPLENSLGIVQTVKRQFPAMGERFDTLTLHLNTIERGIMNGMLNDVKQGYRAFSGELRGIMQANVGTESRRQLNAMKGAVDEVYAKATGARSGVKPTQYRNESNYTLQGGQNYKETVFVLDEPIATNSTPMKNMGHFSDLKNNLFHVRYDVRSTPNGKKAFVIHEIQSDANQAIAKQLTAKEAFGPNARYNPFQKQIETKLLIEQRNKLLQNVDNMTNADVAALQTVNKQIARLGANRAGANKDYYPLLDSDAYGDYALKYLLNKAAKENVSYVAVMPFNKLHFRQGYKAGNERFYGYASGKGINNKGKSVMADLMKKTANFQDSKAGPIKLSLSDPSKPYKEIATDTFKYPKTHPLSGKEIKSVYHEGAFAQQVEKGLRSITPDNPNLYFDAFAVEVKPGMAYTQKLYKREGGLVVDIFKPLC
jgi:hypothetical protein|tara:strand:+ start:1137 stop:3020 length:1884 start_codon:yes stop_codon:yes gene_type:complete